MKKVRHDDDIDVNGDVDGDDNCNDDDGDYDDGDCDDYDDDNDMTRSKRRIVMMIVRR